MKPLLRALLMLALCGSAACYAEDTTALTAPVISTSECGAYPQVTCTSADALAVADTLRLATETRDQLAPLLQLGPTWRFPVHIHIMTPDDPLLAKVDREASAVFAQGAGMKIEAVLPSTDPDARAFIQRQFVIAILWEKFFASTQSFDSHTHLDIVPIWLIEGLRETLNEDTEHNRESIVRKAVHAQQAPTLADVTSWQEVSRDRLLGLWQRSFCYYLVNSLIRKDAQRQNFQQWLGTFAGNNPTSAQYLFPTEAGWQRELVEATTRSRDLVYSWDETASELAATETITIPADKPSNTRVCTIDTVDSFPRDPKTIAAIQSKVRDLTALELRAHPSWHPILELYRSGLTLLTDGPDQVAGAKKLIQEAHRQRAAEIAYRQKLVDYVNWFEVTRDYGGNSTHFGSYFSTAHEMERVQADPAHPNPIRVSLLQIESEL